MKLIDADVVIKGVQDRCLGATSVIVVENRIIDMLNRMPAVDVVPVRHGKWIDRNTRMQSFSPWHRYRCSVCDECSDNFNYCPNCGARMDEDE